MSIPISTGSGAASVAAEAVSGLQYQQVEVLGKGGASTLGVNPDGSINVSVVGAIAVTGSIVTVGNGSISGAVNVAGSVLLGNSNASVITVWQNASILAVPVGSVVAVLQSSSIIGVVTGSVVAIASGNQSVSGALNVSGSVMLGSSNASVITVWQNSSVLAVPVGSVITVGQGSIAVAIISGSIAATVTPPANQSVSGAVTVAGSVLLGSSSASVITVWQSSSVLAVPVGSVVAVLQAPSIVGTYAEDAAATTGDKGLFVLGVRNDAVASFTSANLDYNPIGVDSAGRTMTKPFAAEESRIEGYASLVSTSVTTLVAAAGTGLRNYITDIMVANTGAATTLITFRSGGGTSVLGYTIAPTGGGSNVIGLAMPLRTLANETFDFQPTTASSILFVTVKGFKAP